MLSHKRRNSLSASPSFRAAYIIALAFFSYRSPLDHICTLRYEWIDVTSNVQTFNISIQVSSKDLPASRRRTESRNAASARFSGILSPSFHPLRKFPGPWLAKASVFPFALRVLNGQMDKWTSKLHLRYGDVVRIMPDELSFINPAAWADIYVSRPQLPR